MKHLIGLRKRYRAFGSGTLRFLSPENPRVLAFVRQWQDERILVVANLSRFAQAAELDLAEFEGTVPVEMFGRTPFPRIGTTPYSITLGQHAFYWFLLPAAEGITREVTQEWRAPMMALRGGWQELVTGGEKDRLEAVLPAYLRRRRWFRGKAREIVSVSVSRALPIPVGEREVLLAIVDVSYLDGDAEHYVLPVGHAEGTEAADLLRQAPDTVLTNLPRGEILYDATADEKFVNVLVDGMGRRRRWRSAGAELVASRTQAFGALEDQTGDLRASPLRAEQTNSSVNLGDRLLLKFFRKAEPGVNPDLEIGRFLTEQTGFRRIPLLAGGLELRSRNREPITIGVLHQFVAGEGDAWRLALNALGQYFERALVASGPPSEAELAPVGLFDLAVQEPPARIEELTGPFLSQVRLLGQRTAEMHVALASSTEHPAFAPEPFTALYRRSLYQSARSAVRTTFDLLRRRLPTVAEPLQHQARTLIGMEEPLLRRIRTVTDRKLVATRIRIHGDYHLGQVLYTGRDFIILDFEGEPSRSISERRFKRSPLRDVAGMIRSFEYAAAYGLLQGPTRAEDAPALAPWARLWRRWASARFLQGYLGVASGAGFLPPNPDDLRAMLELYLIDKTVYELRYELNNRPDWVGHPAPGAAAPGGAGRGADGGSHDVKGTAARDPAAPDPTELAQLTAGTHPDPHHLLGAHPTDGGVVIRALHPDAVAAECLLEDGRAVTMAPLGKSGVFAAVLEGRTLPLRYRFRFQFAGGGAWEQDDPYRFLPSVGDVDSTCSPREPTARSGASSAPIHPSSTAWTAPASPSGLRTPGA